MRASCIDKKINVNVQKKAGYQYNAHTRPLFFSYICTTHGPRTPNEASFLLKSQTFGLGKTNRADQFWGIWGIFVRTKYQHSFWNCESLVYVFHYSTNISTKKIGLYISGPLYVQLPNNFLGLRFEFGPQRIKDLAFVCP